MKSILILALMILFIGCNKEEEVKTPDTEVRNFDPLMVDAQDQARLKTICDALDSKEERLPSLETSKYIFAYSEKGCNDSNLGPESDVKVSIQREGTNYVFRKNYDENFSFPNVETSDVGVMSVICANIHDLRSPLQTSSKGAIWFTTITSQKQCASDYNSMCVNIQKGEVQSGQRYTIHTQEWIKFKVQDERRGFFVERRMISQADCADGKKIEKYTRLK